MASRAEMDAMANRPPVGYLTLVEAVSAGAQPAVNIIGVVKDFLPLSRSNGTDYQMTLTLIDNSLLPHGVKVKFFKRLPQDMPAVQTIGDVVLLRRVKFMDYRSCLSGIASYHTEHIVFPRDAVVTPDFRVSYAVQGAYLNHAKSDGADMPNMAEQQWVITLAAYWKRFNHLPTEPTIPAEPPTAPAAMRAIASVNVVNPRDRNFVKPPAHVVPLEPRPHHSVLPIVRTSVSDKFSLIRNLILPTTGRKGNYNDIAGEVIKIHYNKFDTHDLVICDYTSNNSLHSYEPSEVDKFGKSLKPGPRGKMVFQIELSPPHGHAAYQSLQPGDYAYVKNVFVKSNVNGKLVGSLYEDQRFRDQVNIYPLDKTSTIYSDLLNRRRTFYEARGSNDDSKHNDDQGKTKKSKKRIKQQRKEAIQRAKALTEKENRQEQSGSDGDDASDEDERPVKQAKFSSPSLLRAVTPAKLMCSATCYYPDVPFSTFNAILENEYRVYIPPAGKKRHELPFVNAKHHIRARVVDFYPHDLRKFALAIPTKYGERRVVWKWDFWLVLRSDTRNNQDEINVNVSGVDAEMLIGETIRPQDLTVEDAAPAVKQLDEILSTLWGDLWRKKDSFLHAHPHIKADEDFSASKYNIMTDNPPFETCIAEYGVQMSGVEDKVSLNLKQGWARIYKLFGTRIQP